ncbi:hypothetical protein [Sphingomonas bacterium]|uniref:hypothetical protein n=1 Tax=Sphingomonas bacterium TaxID=1895847 RepID=UPI0015759C88|nr:hypothetical protein [Sphingomonas bacterium]
MPLHDTGRAAGQGAALAASVTTFPASIGQGETIATLSDPFAGLGLGTTSFAGFGTAPPQLHLAGDAILAGSGAPAANGRYALGILATSGDGRRMIGETIVLTAQGGVAATPAVMGLPAVAVAPLAVWSPCRLITGYVGATMRAVVAGAITAGDDGNPVMTGLAAAGDAVDIVYDQTGNGRHLTQTVASARPTLAAVARQGVQPLSFVGNTSMQMPAGVTGDHQAVTLFDVYGYNSLQNGSPGRLGTVQGAAALQFGANAYDGGAPFTSGAAMATGRRATMMQPQVVTYTGSAGAARIGCDGIFGDDAAAPSATSFAGGHVGKGDGGGDGGLQFLARVIYSAALSSIDEASVRTALNAIFGTGGFAGATAQIIVNGNSVEYGAGTASVSGGNGINGWVRQMIPLLKARVPVISLAAGGRYLQDQSAFAYNNDSLFRPGLTNLCIAMEPTNDIAYLMGQLDAPAATFTANSVGGSAQLVNVSSTGGLVVGQSIRGGASGADGTSLRTVVAIGGGTVTLSDAAAATVTGATYTAGARYAGSLTGGSAVITGLTATIGLGAGQMIEAPGIAAGTTIQSVDGPDRITLSMPATAGGTQTLVATAAAAVQNYAEVLFASHTEPFVAGRRAAGFKLLVLTVLPRRWDVYAATRGQMDLARRCYNAKVAASAAGLGYTLLDRGNLPALTDPTDTARYAGDGTHPRDAGAALIAAYAASVINPLLP